MEMPVVLLVGNPHERGVAHGSRFRREISAILDRDLGLLAERDLSSACGRAAAAFEQIRQESPEVAAELQGIAEGAGRSVPEIVLRSGFELLQAANDTGCSALAVKTQSGAIAAQNWDGSPAKHGELGFFLHCSQKGFEFAFVASFGGLGFAGINHHGLALVNNDLMLQEFREGMPSQVVRRIVLQQSDVRSAAERLSSLQHVGGRAYLLADRKGEIGAVEISAKTGAHFFPPADVHFHTNHALLETTSGEEDAATLLAIYPSSIARLNALGQALEREAASIEGVKRVLRDEVGAPNSVCKTSSSDESTETAFSIILDAANGEVHIAAGKPSVNAYRRIVLPSR